VASTTAYVDYRTEDGTANAGSDYLFVEGTLMFEPGETLAQFDIQVLDDDVFEEDEHFFVNLSNVRLTEEPEGTGGNYPSTS
jgi:solute carrier family 8 (sodium/calcium exchanger)